MGQASRRDRYRRTASSPEKIALARAHGFDHVINYRDTDFVAAVREITGGKMCDVVYDSVGKDTFPASLDCLKPRSLFVTLRPVLGSHSASQPGDPVPPGFSLCDAADALSYIAKRDELSIGGGIVRGGSPLASVENSRRSTALPALKRLRRTDLEAARTTGTHVIVT